MYYCLGFFILNKSLIIPSDLMYANFQTHTLTLPTAYEKDIILCKKYFHCLRKLLNDNVVC